MYEVKPQTVSMKDRIFKLLMESWKKMTAAIQEIGTLTAFRIPTKIVEARKGDGGPSQHHDVRNPPS